MLVPIPRGLRECAAEIQWTWARAARREAPAPGLSDSEACFADSWRRKPENPLAAIPSEALGSCCSHAENVFQEGRPLLQAPSAASITAFRSPVYRCFDDASIPSASRR